MTRVPYDDQQGDHTVAADLYPSSGFANCPSMGAIGYGACPVTPRLADRLNLHPIKGVEPLCRCQQQWQGVTINAPPVLLALTCLHEAYPQEQHRQPYPTTPDGAPRIDALPDPVPRLVAEQCERFAGLYDAVVPVDLTRPDEGYDDPNYGGEAFKRELLRLPVERHVAPPRRTRRHRSARVAGRRPAQ